MERSRFLDGLSGLGATRDEGELHPNVVRLEPVDQRGRLTSGKVDPRGIDRLVPLLLGSQPPGSGGFISEGIAPRARGVVCGGSGSGRRCHADLRHAAKDDLHCVRVLEPASASEQRWVPRCPLQRLDHDAAESASAHRRR